MAGKKYPITSDVWIDVLDTDIATPIERELWLYLSHNSHIDISGLYSINMTTIIMELKFYSRSEVQTTVQTLKRKHIIYNEDNWYYVPRILHDKKSVSMRHYDLTVLNALNRLSKESPHLMNSSLLQAFVHAHTDILQDAIEKSQQTKRYVDVSLAQEMIAKKGFIGSQGGNVKELPIVPNLNILDERERYSYQRNVPPELLAEAHITPEGIYSVPQHKKPLPDGFFMPKNDSNTGTDTPPDNSDDTPPPPPLPRPNSPTNSPSGLSLQDALRMQQQSGDKPAVVPTATLVPHSIPLGNKNFSMAMEVRNHIGDNPTLFYEIMDACTTYENTDIFCKQHIGMSYNDVLAIVYKCLEVSDGYPCLQRFVRPHVMPSDFSLTPRDPVPCHYIYIYIYFYISIFNLSLVDGINNAYLGGSRGGSSSSSSFAPSTLPESTPTTEQQPLPLATAIVSAPTQVQVRMPSIQPSHNPFVATNPAPIPQADKPIPTPDDLKKRFEETMRQSDELLGITTPSKPTNVAPTLQVQPSQEQQPTPQAQPNTTFAVLSEMKRSYAYAETTAKNTPEAQPQSIMSVISTIEKSNPSKPSTATTTDKPANPAPRPQSDVQQSQQQQPIPQAQPNNIQEVIDEMKRLYADPELRERCSHFWHFLQPEGEAHQFWNYYSDKKWQRKSAYGLQPIVDWKLAALRWITKMNVDVPTAPVNYNFNSSTKIQDNDESFTSSDLRAVYQYYNERYYCNTFKRWFSSNAERDTWYSICYHFEGIEHYTEQPCLGKMKKYFNNNFTIQQFSELYAKGIIQAVPQIANVPDDVRDMNDVNLLCTLKNVMMWEEWYNAQPTTTEKFEVVLPKHIGYMDENNVVLDKLSSMSYQDILTEAGDIYSNSYNGYKELFHA